MSQHTNNQLSGDTTEIKNEIVQEPLELTEEELADVAGGGFSHFFKHVAATVVHDAENMGKGTAKNAGNILGQTAKGLIIGLGRE